MTEARKQEIKESLKALTDAAFAVSDVLKAKDERKLAAKLLLQTGYALGIVSFLLEENDRLQSLLKNPYTKDKK